MFQTRTYHLTNMNDRNVLTFPLQPWQKILVFNVKTPEDFVITRFCHAPIEPKFKKPKDQNESETLPQLCYEIKIARSYMSSRILKDGLFLENSYHRANFDGNLLINENFWSRIKIDWSIKGLIFVKVASENEKNNVGPYQNQISFNFARFINFDFDEVKG